MNSETEALILGLAEMLKARGWMCATAESCTGGLIGAALTSISGSSEWYLGGVISYANSVKAGLLGVEGMGREELTKALSPFVDGGGRDKFSSTEGAKKITKTDLYLDGFSGTDGASEKRAKLLNSLGLPDDMTANAMLSALNIIVSYDEYKSLVSSLDDGND